MQHNFNPFKKIDHELTLVNSELDGDLSAGCVGRISECFAYVCTAVFHSDVGHFEASVHVPRTGWKCQAVASDPVDSDPKGALVAALEDDLATCGYSFGWISQVGWRVAFGLVRFG